MTYPTQPTTQSHYEQYLEFVAEMRGEFHNPEHSE
jgi:hypothetical protein